MSGRVPRWERDDTPPAYSIEDMPIVPQQVFKLLAAEFGKIWIFGSRVEGRWHFTSDFDIGVEISDSVELKRLSEELSLKLGVHVDLRDVRCVVGYYRYIELEG